MESFLQSISTIRYKILSSLPFSLPWNITYTAHLLMLITLVLHLSSIIHLLQVIKLNLLIMLIFLQLISCFLLIFPLFLFPTFPPGISSSWPLVVSSSSLKEWSFTKINYSLIGFHRLWNIEDLRRDKYTLNPLPPLPPLPSPLLHLLLLNHFASRVKLFIKLFNIWVVCVLLRALFVYFLIMVYRRSPFSPPPFIHYSVSSHSLV